MSSGVAAGQLDDGQHIDVEGGGAAGADAAQADADGAEAAPRVVLEENVALSGSMMWDLQRSFFDSSGASAWITGGVPHYITTNPHIARSYARTVYGFLRDAWASEPRVKKDRPADPVIVELGAGSGQFAFNFLRAIEELHRESPTADRDFTYVMTDFTRANVDFWREHPPLAPWIESGRLDLAEFDAANPAPITMEVSGVELAAGGDARPVVVIANYVLDSIPQELLTATSGGVMRHLVTVSSSQEEPDLVADGILDRLQFEWTPTPLGDDYRGDASVTHVIDWYTEQMFGAAWLLPLASLRCLDFFRGLGEGPQMALVGDRGYGRLTDLLVEQGPQIGLHGGCFSLPVNFHALGLWAEFHGGRSLSMTGGHSSLHVGGFVTGFGKHVPYETTAAYRAAIDEAGPDDFFAIKSVSEWALGEIGLAEALALLRWSAWDPVVFSGLLPRLVLLAETSEQADFADLRRAARRVWDAHYPLPGGLDLAFSIAALLYGMEYYDEALEFLGRSVELAGPHSSTSYNIGMAHVHLHQLDLALAAMEESLDLDPTFDAARSMCVTIRAELEAGG